MWVFPLVLIQVKSVAKRAVLGLKNKREKAFLLLNSQLFHIQVVRYVASTIKSFFNALTASNASISIPHGTIKSVFVSTPYPPYDIFQFHMVRLKGLWPYKPVSVRNISIPHGTIKSVRGTGIHSDELRISIPHGTIKRLSETDNQYSPSIISIPHGTIKSPCVQSAASVQVYFNSTWYD